MKVHVQKHCFTLMIMAMIATSLATVSMPVFSADGDVTFDLTYYYPGGIVPGVAPGGYLAVDVYVDASALTTELGMHGWGLTVYVDSSVLTPLAAVGGTSGYFLYDWSEANYPPPFPGGPLPYPPSFIQVVGTENATHDYINCAEFFMPLPPTGANGVGKLCTLYFMSQNETAYSRINIDRTLVFSGYQDATGAKYLINPVDGHYNMPTAGYLFEQFLGSTWPAGDPSFTDWHELEPVFCQNWTLESWLDNGDGHLSPSDRIDMFRIEPPQPDPDPYWFHVEWVNPAPVAGDGIPDLLVTKISPGIPPLASFTFSPAEPIEGETVTFDASASYDPDGEIVSYAWDFGDGASGSGVSVEHAYATAGTYVIVLTVTDNDGLTDTATDVISVSPAGIHDIAVISVSASPMQVTAGELVTITAIVANQGDFTEVFSLIAYYDTTEIELASVTLDAGQITPRTFTWDTAGVPPDTYMIRAEATVVEGEVDTNDNMLVDGTVTVTSPPPLPMLSIKLSGEHDYLLMENVKLRLAALVKDAATMDAVSDANVTIGIYDPNGALWLSDVMVEMVAGTGIYEWQSEGTIRQMRLAKGVYLVYVQASCQGEPTASDILAFHIDPPAEGTNRALYHIAFTAVALVSLAGLILKRRKIINRLRKFSRRN